MAGKKSGPRNPELIEKIRRLYENEGMTLQAIADQLGMSQKAVNKLAKRWGVQMRRRGPLGGEGHPNWKGHAVDKSGYILVKSPDHPHANHNGYVRQHRLVAEQMLGRFLERTEVVHHKNDDRSDNRPENLQVFRTNGEHLAETLAGKCPNWTSEGMDRIAESYAEQFGVDANEYRRSLERGVQRTQENSRRSTAERDRSPRAPSQTEPMPEQPPGCRSRDSCSGRETAS